MPRLIPLLVALAGCAAQDLTDADPDPINLRLCRDGGVVPDAEPCVPGCAEGWGTCTGGPMCGRRIHTATDCARCGDACDVAGEQCRSFLWEGQITWGCVIGRR